MIKSLRNIAVVCLLVSALFVGLFALDSENAASGATLYVGGAGGGNFTTIQDAINASFDGDTVFVYNGTYVENVIVNRTITLIGEHWSNTTIDGGGGGNVVQVTNDWVNITGFTIANGNIGIRIMTPTNNVTISNNNISSNNQDGILLEYSSGNTITNNNFLNGWDGIALFNSSGNNIIGNYISNNEYGIFLVNSSGNNIIGNNASSNNMHGIFLTSAVGNTITGNDALNNNYGIYLSSSDGNNITGNTANSNNWDGINLNSASGNTITNNNASYNNWNGFYLSSSVGNTIMGNTANSNTEAGIYGESSNDNYISGNIASMNGWFGIVFNYSSDNIIEKNIANNNGIVGIKLWATSSTNITDNTILYNDYGIYLWNSNNNTINDNLVRENNLYGFYIIGTPYNNTIYHNNIINNPTQAYDEGTNIWNDTSPIGGNFFSDWTFPDSDCDGFVDDPYLISGGSNQDNLPFTEESGWLSAWLNKSAFANYAPSGMPDFDQREKSQRTGQNYWMTMNAGPDGILDPFTLVNILGDDVLVNGTPGQNNISIAPGLNHMIDTPLMGDDTLEYSYCGPTAAANALWWLDSRYGDPAGTPGDGLDIFSLVADYFPGDDHLPANVPFLIEDLATRFNTDNMGDTNATAMVDGLNQLLLFAGLSSNFAVTNESWPDFPVVATEFENCNAVILFLGFYDDEGKRVFGHIVTMSGVNQGMMKISISDPIKNVANPMAIFSSYNDTQNVSHDIYDVMMGPPHPSLPPTTWWLAPYTSGYTFPMPPLYYAAVENVVYITPLLASVPTEPLGLSATSGDSYVNLTWSPPADDGGSAIIGYNVYRDGGFLIFVPAGQLWYNDTSVTNGGTYVYNVTAVNGVGEGSNSTGVSETPMTVPSVPQSPVTSSGDGYVNITWSAPLDDGGSTVLFYNIYRNGTAGVYATVPASQLWYNDTSVINGVTYTYNISAVNGVGEGPNSTGVSETPMTVPSAPQTPGTSSGDGYVNITWAAPADDGGSTILFYNIYRNGTAGVYDTVSASQLWYNDTNVTNGVTYTYNISAVNGVGEGPQTADVMGTPMTVPSTPQSPATTSGDSYVNITWAAPADDGGSTVLWYNIYRNGTTGVYDTVSASQLWYNDTNVTNGVTYTYNISAVNAVGEGPQTGDVMGTPTSSPTIPSAPQTLGANSGDGYVNLTWTAPASDGGSAIIFYNIYRNGTMGIYDTVPASQLWYNDTNVTNGVTYTYNISAVNAVGEGPQTADVMGTPMTVPSTPQSPATTSGDSYVNITWTIPADDGGSTILFYNIYRNGTVGVYDTVPASQLWYNDTNVTNGVTFTYNISAVNAVGEGPQTADVFGTPTSSVTVPSVPQNLQESSGNGYVNLTWAAPASDGGSAITGYNIYRNGTTGVYATVPAGQLWYLDTNVTNGITYTYNVSAVNAIGEGPSTSDVSGTPMTVPTAVQNLQAETGVGYVNLTWDVPLDDGGSAITDYYIYRNGTSGFYANISAGQTWFNDTSVIDGVTYTYNVSAVNGAGEGPNSTISATPGITTVPTEPLNLQANFGDEYVNLTWDVPASDGGSTILWYYIYRNDTAGVYNVVVGTQLWFNDTLVTNGESYTYNVSAENAVGEGPNSTDVAANPLGVPSAPQNPDVISEMDLLNITWEAPASDGGTPITGYNIYRNGTAGVYASIPAGQLWYNDTTVLNNTMYTYNITAVNAKGEGPAALTFGTPLTTPAAPRNLAAEAGAGYVLLTWGIPLNNGSSDITTYNIYRNDTNGTFGQVFGNQLSFNDTNAENGVNYTYHITAVNAQGESPNSTSVFARPESPPYVPESFIVIAGNGFVNLSWDEPFDGGSPITEYFVYRNGATGPYVILAAGQLWFNDTDVTNGEIYTYFISANNSHGEGTQTEEISVMAGAVPSPPLIVALSLQVTASSVTFSWTTPLDDGGKPITNYKVYKGTVSGDWTVYQPFTNNLTYTDNTVTPGFTYYYVVTAENFVGESKFSEEVIALPLGPPDMPTAFTVFAGDSYVILTWKVPFTDGGSSITNYRIYRGTSSNEIPILVELENVLSYNDTTVTNDVTYFYVISAKNAEGEGIKTGDLNATPEAPLEPVNKVPSVVITTPIDGVRWAKTATISGTASDSDGDVEKVEIRFNDGEWILANGTEDWSYEVDPKDLPNGENIIYARSYDGENYSKEVNVTVNVEITEDDGDDGILGVALIVVGIILLIIVLLFLLMFLVKRRPEREYEEEEEEEEEEE